MLKSKAGHGRHRLFTPSPLRDLLDSVSRRVARSRPWRVLCLSVKNFVRNNDPLWASALTYTTTLSIVPILALALSTVGALHATAGLHRLIQRYIAAGSPEIADRIVSFVSNTDNSELSAFGGVALLVTAIMTLGAVEQAFNNIFHAPEARSLARKVTDYLGVIFAVPPIIVATVAFREGIAGFLPHWLVLRWVVSSLMLWGGICFLYVFFPYTKVRGRSALVGGLAAALLLDLARRAFIHFQYGVSSYKAIYGALAAIPILMTWTYISWTILLYGGELAAALQSGADVCRPEDESSPQDFARGAALLTMLRLAERMMNRRARVSADSIAGELGVAQETLTPVLSRLKDAGLVVEAQDRRSESQHPGLFLARDPGLISLAEVIQHAHAVGEVRVSDPRVQSAIHLLTERESEILQPLTVRDLLGEGSAGDQLVKQGAMGAAEAALAKSS